LRGLICPTALGSYRYRKRQRNGASLMVDVDVFPLAVNRELEHWKEQDQRERRWVSLNDAAEMVDEPDLADLIRSFGPAEFKAATKRLGVIAATQSRISPMFAWFQRLLPKQGNFFDLFEAHAVTIVSAADAMARLLAEDGHPADHIREVIEREHDADNITRQVLKTVRETFLTPFDRSSITALIGSMDDTVDEMQAAVQAMDVYDVRVFDQEMKDMAAIIVDAARLTAEAMPLLRKIGDNGHRLHELTERLVRMEGHADEIHAAGLKRLFKADSGPNGERGDPMHFFVRQEMFKRLERVVDRFEDLANEIDGLVIDHS
jgi:uncharacterized protein Yka (UPF0111/DUF47 family)